VPSPSKRSRSRKLLHSHKSLLNQRAGRLRNNPASETMPVNSTLPRSARFLAAPPPVWITAGPVMVWAMTSALQATTRVAHIGRARSALCCAEAIPPHAFQRLGVAGGGRADLRAQGAATQGRQAPVRSGPSTNPQRWVGPPRFISGPRPHLHPPRSRTRRELTAQRRRLTMPNSC
jgi:hypothetical protein